MKMLARLEKLELEVPPDDSLIWIAHQVEKAADTWSVQAVRSEEEPRLMTGAEIERTLTGTVICVVPTAKKEGL
jgi:hypothetical protein